MAFWNDLTPQKNGWYAVLRCFCEREGLFPSGAYWNGEEWDRKAVVLFGGEPLENERLAESLAYDNDPEDVL